MVAIYKITSPSGKIYIGQTWNTVKRFSRYRLGDVSKQPKVHCSFKSHGVAAHKIEIVHELPPDVDQRTLDEYERLYIKLYKDCGIELLNMNDGGNGCKPSKETREKMSRNRKGIPLHIRIGEEAARKQIERMKLKKGVPHSKEHSANISKGLTGKKLSESHVRNLSLSKKGRRVWNKGLIGIRKASEETKRKQSEARKKYLLTNPVTGICATYINRRA